jgi:NADPH:quinone reductase-like Zn-dependent oxidoreductase
LRNFAIFGAKTKQLLESSSLVGRVVLDGIPVDCGMIESPAPVFKSGDAANDNRVLVRVRAFSVNYRDKNRIFTMAMKGTDTGYYVIGSEFVAEIVDVGSNVTEFSIGDRVIGNNSYPNSGWDGVAPGVPTNHASKEFQIFHKAKLIKVPDSMPDAIAAAFSIGAQTTYSMIRRLEIFDGANVLVTSAKSNTSLFAINALKFRKINLYATSTSDRFHCELVRRGVKEVLVIAPEVKNFLEHPRVREVVTGSRGFDFVIDPYFDLHLSRLLDAMAIGGKYITCGLYDQYLALIQRPALPSYTTGRELMTVMLKNLQIMGNCIGLTSDLQTALNDFDAGMLDVVIDSVFCGKQITEFLDRTYNAQDKLGKVVYKYD